MRLIWKPWKTLCRASERTLQLAKISANSQIVESMNLRFWLQESSAWDFVTVLQIRLDRQANLDLCEGFKGRHVP